MSLKLAQISLLVLNILSTFAAVATVAISWNDNRTLAWFGIGALAAATVLGRLTPLFYMAGIIGGPGLLAYAMSGRGVAGLVASLVVTMAFYLFTWQARTHKPVSR